MLADNKKCQTLINIAAEQVELLKIISDKLQRCRQLYEDQNVDSTGTVLEGNISAISDWIDDVNSVANNAIAEGLISHKVSTHRNKALGDL